MRKEALENLTEGPRPSLHVSDPNWDMLRGLVERASATLADAKRKSNSVATRFNAAYNAAFYLARAALEACGYRLASGEGHRVAVFQSLANTLE